MSRFSKVSYIFGRDASATMRYVTLLNVSEIRDISNDERKVPFKNDEYDKDIPENPPAITGADFQWQKECSQ